MSEQEFGIKKEDIISYDLERYVKRNLGNIDYRTKDFILNLIFFLKLKGIITEEEIQKRLIEGNFNDLRKDITFPLAEQIPFKGH